MLLRIEPKREKPGKKLKKAATGPPSEEAAASIGFLKKDLVDHFPRLNKHRIGYQL